MHVSLKKKKKKTLESDPLRERATIHSSLHLTRPFPFLASIFLFPYAFNTNSNKTSTLFDHGVSSSMNKNPYIVIIMMKYDAVKNLKYTQQTNSLPCTNINSPLQSTKQSFTILLAPTEYYEYDVRTKSF
jgi:hypothetical protein